MKLSEILIVCLGVLPVAFSYYPYCPTDEKKVVCYFASWAIYRPAEGAFKVEDIDPFMCTHIFYTFAGLDINGHMVSLDIENDVTRHRQFQKAIEMKQVNPCLKVVLAIGGWNEGSEKYSLLAATEKSRTDFAEQALKFLVFYGFDGLDIDWEYPTMRGGLPDDKENYVKLMKKLKETLAPRNKLLTAAFGVTSTYITSAYDMEALCEIIDFGMVMAYDFHELNRTSINAPLHREEGQNPHTETIAENVDLMISLGCPIEKLVLGIATYGRTYTLLNEENVEVDAEVKALGNAGPLTLSEGSLGFNEICEKLSKGGWTTVHLIENASKVSFKGDQWMSYDDPETVYQKTVYAMDMGFGGVMFWTMDTDCFSGKCYQQPYPLIETAKKVLKGNTHQYKEL